MFIFSSSSENWCTGSLALCDYFSDINGTFSHLSMKESVWPSNYNTNGDRRHSYLFKLAQSMMENTIIVRLQYKRFEVEMNKLDVRTTMTDKIANFGGTFGIWGELTGCSLLGMINLLVIVFKVILNKCFN